ncbi:MAG: RRXRR domain-containing protein [Stigonema ocellatum SAG 48.90 = DSM 106950]|nr:RRXRR domain-containing protein [Stigonema ocellatum SAG 48.90 = DSM 106950]
MSKVLVIDADKRPQNPIHPAQARQMLRNKKAAVFRRFPFTIILKEPRPDTSSSPLRIKIDRSAKHTGIVIVIVEGKKLKTSKEVILNVSEKDAIFHYRDSIDS